MVSALATTPADPTSGHWEGVNPTRRYRWFHPRQAAWAAGTIASSVNFPNLNLYNDGPNQILVVRSITFDVQTTQEIGAVLVQGGNTGTLRMRGLPFVSGDGAPPGQLFASDAAIPTSSMWDFDALTNTTIQIAPFYPLFAIQTGWSLQLFGRLTATFLRATFLYEHIYPDELDFFW